MVYAREIPQTPWAGLSRQDLVDFEPLLKGMVAEFLVFKSYSLYFPQTLPRTMREDDDSFSKPRHLPGERTLLLPLCLDGDPLAVFVARGVTLRAPKTSLQLLAMLAGNCLEKLRLLKTTVTDPMTGLFTEEHFITALAREIEGVRQCVQPAAESGEHCRLPAYRACLGVVLARVDNLDAIRKQNSLEFSREVMSRLATDLKGALPDQARAARLGPDTLAVFAADVTPKACQELADRIQESLGQARFKRELTGEVVRPLISVGSVSYPKDMTGGALERSAEDQAAGLVDRAVLALKAAAETGKGPEESRAFAFSRILTQGGRVLSSPRQGKISINLGRLVQCRDGYRFLVRDSAGNSPGDGYKGEIVVMEVDETTALAEVMHLKDPARPIVPGDGLILIREALIREALTKQGAEAEGCSIGEGAGNGLIPDAATGLLRYKDFLDCLTQEAQNAERFTLGLVQVERLEQSAQDGTNDSGSEELVRDVDHKAAKAANLARKVFGPETLGGRFSLHGLIFFHPGLDGERAKELHLELHARAREELGLGVVSGLSCHPFLNFTRSDVLENCRKALEYALLLPEPRVGLCDTLALNISADKSFSLGDLYAAMEEYKLALLADPDNTMAHNSLGVCLARLGESARAKRHFLKALEVDPTDVRTLYNLGYVCWRLGEAQEAAQTFRRCLKRRPGHVFSLIRLGQLAEARNDLGLARRYYNRAALADSGFGLTRRYLARLSVRQHRFKEAREHLHQALLHDPGDAHSHYLLAKIYLDSGEDPEIAEMLARQSVALRPGRKNFWLELARALETTGKSGQARTAMAKAAEL